MRLFVALPLPEDVRASIAGMQDDPRVRVRWVPPSQLHLTLCFIGEWPENERSPLIRSLQRIEASPFSLKLGDRGWLGRPPRILFVGVRPAEPVVALMHAVEAAVQSVGGSRSNRSAWPHITVARAKNPPPFAVRRWRDAAMDPAGQACFSVGRFALYQSELSAKGACYTELASFGLGRS